MLLKATKIIENEKEILETAELLMELRNKFEQKYPDKTREVINWTLEQTIMRLSLKTGHEFGTGVQ